MLSSLAPQDYELLANQLPTLCWVARPDGFIVWYNDRWHRYCGTTPASMEGWGWQSVHHPDHLAQVMARWQSSIAQGQPFEMVFPLRGADGVYRPFLTRIIPVRGKDGQIARWLGVNTDISAQVEVEEKLDDSRRLYQTLTDAMPQMVWSTLPDGFHDYYNARWYEFTGVPAGSTDGEGWNGVFHPEDQERAWARWRHSLKTGEAYEIEYRLRHRSGEYRWTLGRAMPVRNERGEIVRWIGTCTDINDAKMIAAQNELLNRELSHRIKNIFSIIGGLIALSARHEPAAAGFARQLSDRVSALGRAHEFARPHSETSRPDFETVTLKGLLTSLFAPYDLEMASRVEISGDDVDIDDKGATPLALLFHELATNAAKYGALSVPEGRVHVSSIKSGDSLKLVWREDCGPVVLGPPTSHGFGTRLAAMSVERQMGGTLVRDWKPSGLVAEVTVKLDRLLRS